MTATTTTSEAPRHQFTVAEYEAFDINPDRRLELLDGEIYDMAPEYEPHARLVQAVLHALDDAFGRGRVWAYGSVRLDDRTMVQPDVFVLSADHQPGDGPIAAADVVLAVEISASTSRRDERKMAAYARAAIPHAWRYDVAASTFHRHTRPSPAVYTLTTSTLTSQADLPAAVAEAAANL